MNTTAFKSLDIDSKSFVKEFSRHAGGFDRSYNSPKGIMATPADGPNGHAIDVTLPSTESHRIDLPDVLKYEFIDEHLFVISEGNMISVFSLKTGRKQLSFPTNLTVVTDVAISNATSRIAVAGDEKVLIYNFSEKDQD